MKIIVKIYLITAIMAFCAVGALAQKPSVPTVLTDTKQSSPVTSSPAFAELLLRRTELQAELEGILLDYTEEYPRVLEIRNTLGLIDRDMVRISKVKPSETQKLTLALGKLMVRRIELESELWKLRQTYKDEHPEVKRAKRRVEIYEKAISEILN